MTMVLGSGSGVTASHWCTHYRCFLPDLAGFAGSNCAAPRNLISGESGIRTHGGVSPTHAFQACSFNHSDISPGPCTNSTVPTDCTTFDSRISVGHHP